VSRCPGLASLEVVWCTLADPLPTRLPGPHLLPPQAEGFDSPLLPGSAPVQEVQQAIQAPVLRPLDLSGGVSWGGNP